MVRNELVSIAQRIKREARNNPAKAALLAGLLGLALYSWAPLVVGWLGVGEESPSTASRPKRERDEPVGSGSSQRSVESDVASEERPSWQELQQWQERSPWTVPIDMAQMRNPLRPVEGTAEPVVESEEVEDVAASTAEQLVASVDLQVTGTIIGPQRRVVLLDGNAYSEGDTVRVEHLGVMWELEIRQIGPNRVKLGWQSIERELTAPEAATCGAN